MIPSVLTSQIRRGVEDFLQTTFPPSDQFFHGLLDRLIAKEGGLFRGPYLLTQKRDLPYTQVRDALLNTRAGDVLDAYRAVLDLDAGNSALPLRRRLLDVAGGGQEDASGVLPDGKFDEKDLEAFVNAFREAEALREAGDLPDRSRFDLNGDGYPQALSPGWPRSWVWRAFGRPGRWLPARADRPPG